MTEVAVALELADEALNRNRWASIRVDNNKVVLEVGPIMQDGSRERKSATYKFYTDAVGEVHYVVYAHP